MSFQARILSSSIQAKYSVMLSKLIVLLQDHVVELMSLNSFCLDNSLQKGLNPQNMCQKYKFLLGKMKLFEQQKSVQTKFSHLCQPLLNRIHYLDDQKSYESDNFSQKSLPLSSKCRKASNLSYLNRSLDRKDQATKSPSIKHSLDLKKSKENQTKSISMKKYRESLKDFQKYQKASEAPILDHSSPDYCQKHSQPCPGKSFDSKGQVKSAQFNSFSGRQEDEPILPNSKGDIALSKKSLGNQISHRTMTEFSRAKQLQKIDQQMQNYLQDQIQLDKVITEKEVYSFEMVETPSGTVYGQEQQVKPPAKFKSSMYKKFIDRTHLKRSITESG